MFSTCLKRRLQEQRQKSGIGTAADRGSSPYRTRLPGAAPAHVLPPAALHKPRPPWPRPCLLAPPLPAWPRPSTCGPAPPQVAEGERVAPGSFLSARRRQRGESRAGPGGVRVPGAGALQPRPRPPRAQVHQLPAVAGPALPAARGADGSRGGSSSPGSSSPRLPARVELRAAPAASGRSLLCPRLRASFKPDADIKHVGGGGDSQTPPTLLPLL